MQQYMTSSNIIKNTTLNWSSDHCIQEVEMAGMQIIKETSKNTYQRPMWQTSKLTEEAKVLLQNKMDEIIQQDVANSTTEWMEIRVKQWMEENMSRTTNKRNLSLYVSSKEYK